MHCRLKFASLLGSNLGIIAFAREESLEVEVYYEHETMFVEGVIFNLYFSLV